MDFVVAALLLLCVQQFAWPPADAAPTFTPAPTPTTTHAPAPTTTPASAPSTTTKTTSATKSTTASATTLSTTPTSATKAAAASSSPQRIEDLLESGNSTADAVALTGRVIDASPTWGEGVRLTVQVETARDAPAEGLVSVSLRETSRRWRTGDRLALTSRLRRLTSFGNFGELDWPAYNARRGIFVTAYAWQDEDARVLAADDGVVDFFRRRFSEACEAVGGQGAEILEALIIGDRTGISMATAIAVRDAGLAHFLAISGSHMALLVVVVVAGVRWLAGLRPALLERYDVLRAAAVLAAVAVVAYGTVTGGGVSVARSELMAVAAMAALWRGRPGDDLRALGGSAIVLALAMPGVGEEAGFQLSYLAVIALILDSRRQRARRREERRPRAIVIAPTGRIRNLLGAWPAKGLEALLEAARLTVVCWAVTSPVVAHHFQRLSLVAPLANLLAAPLVSAIVIGGIASLVLLPVSPAAGLWAVRFGALLSDLVVRISVWCASLPLAATTTPAPGAMLTMALTGAALALLLPAGGRRRALVCGLVVVSALLVGDGLRDRYRSDRLDVWFASVGQGDAAIVRMPGGQVWVVDEGPPGRGRMVVGPLLRRAWIGRVDVLVASHLQADHAGAIEEILDDFDVGEIWLPDGRCDTDAATRLRAAASRRRVPLRFVSNAGAAAAASAAVSRNEAAGAGDAVSRNEAAGAGAGVGRNAAGAGDAVSRNEAAGAGAGVDRNAAGAGDAASGESAQARVEVLGPPPGAAACNDNDQSLVMAFGFASRRVLFTGDIEAAAESRVAGTADVRADVLKVPHHGSRTSSTDAFLSAVGPSLAVASLGLDNHFHFPAPDVVARYAAHAVKLLRTDRDGAVHLWIDADGAMRTETFYPPAGREAPR